MRGTNIKEILLYLLGYLLWVLNSALGLLGILIARAVTAKAYITLRLNPWAFGAVDKWGFFLLGLVWLVFVIACEAYYREGVNQGKLWPRVARVTGVEGFLVGIGYVVERFVV